MAGRGKGYFWEGLSQGIRGLYGQVSNERMATQAQNERTKEAALGRAQNAAQFAALLPHKTDEKDESIDYLESNRKALADAEKAEKDAAANSYTPQGLAILKGATMNKKVAEVNYQKAAQHAAKKQGAPEPVGKVAAPKSMSLMEQFKASQKKGK